MKRPSTLLAFIVLALLMTGALVVHRAGQQQRLGAAAEVRLRQLVVRLGATDLAVSTEARYIRHLAVSDTVTVSMDHPGAFDHFPSTMFFAPDR
jgi:hypothetical protein